MSSDREPLTHKKIVTAEVSATGVVTRRQLRPEGKVSVAPEELAKPLRSVVRALWFMSLSAVVILVVSGFKLFGFSLDPRILIAIVGGVSLQFVAAIVSPLVHGITQVLVEKIRAGRS